MDAGRALSIVQRQRGEIASLRRCRSGSNEFTKWHRDTEVAIQRIFGEQSRHFSDLSEIHYSLMVMTTSTSEAEFQRAYVNGLETAQSVLSSMIDEVSEYGLAEAISSPSDALSLIENIVLRFHLVARQLRSRHANRPTIEIEDEYDVQDLLHALLRLHFEDVRAEEWTPSYAGGSSRVDFLLKNEQLVIEVKKTRPNLSSADLGAQLLVDIARYQQHPDCKCLVCFVYDPEGRVGNPIGLERDLKNQPTSLKVRTIVGPKGL